MVEEDKLLCLVEVGHIALRVDAAGEVASAGTVARPP